MAGAKSLRGNGRADASGASGTTLDDLDRRILTELQRNARVSNSRLAELVGVAQSTAHARMRSLVDRGVVTGYSAEIDPAALGLGLQALVSVSIRAGARQAMMRFLDEIKELPEVVQAFFLGGSEDFIVHIAVRDSNAVRDFVVENLSANPAVAATRTSLVFEHHRRRVDLEA